MDSKYTYTIGRDMDLIKEQEKTLSTPRLKSNVILRMMYLTLDLLYGFKRTLPKVKVLEILARYPYWAWENGSYHRLTRLYAKTKAQNPTKVAALHRVIALGRESQDNEQYHMFLMDDMIHQKGIKPGWFRHYLLPRILALGYLLLTKTMYALHPISSFAMNAAFESHAEREYMLMAKENPEWDNEEIDSVYFQYYPRQKTLNDLIRRIALDERDHMYHSLEEMENLK